MNRIGRALVLVVSCLLPLAARAESPSLAADVRQDGAGTVTLRWQTVADPSNLGFDVWRETSEGRIRVNRGPIAGSALFGAGRRQESGRSYAWKDQVRPGEFAQYYIEVIALDGRRTMHGPITPLLDSTPREISASATLASSDAVVSGGIFVSARGIGAPAIAPPPARGADVIHRALATQPGVKLGISTEGWYRVTRSDLIDAGFDPGNDPRRIVCFADGVEQAIVVRDGGDGRFDPDDSIEFYGIGMDTPSSGERAYWIARSSRNGRRAMSEKWRNVSSGPSSTPFTFQRIERTVFFNALVTNGDRDNFFGAVVSTWGAASQEFTLENGDATGGPAVLEVVLQGGTTSAHHVELLLNGSPLGDVEFDGMARKASSFSIPVAALQDGAKTLTLTALAGDDDITVVESLRLQYPHRLIADDDALKVITAGGKAVHVDGFSSNQVRAIDITTPARPTLLTVRTSLRPGGWRASFSTQGSGKRRVLVLGESRIAEPDRITATTPSNWSNPQNRADLVVIATPGLIDTAGPLRDLRESEGLETVAVTIDALYDEFNFGVPGPEAIRRFLARTRSWELPPRYVLLLGDATVDPRNYLEQETFDFVPTKLVASNLMKTASDDWFADFRDRGLPHLAIGRLPARTVAEAEIMIGKIVNRDTSSDRVVFIAGENDLNDFEGAADDMAAAVPDSWTKSIVRIGSTVDDPAAIEESFDSLVLTYTGHGLVNGWISGPTGEAQFAGYQNGPTLPIVASITCLNGYFFELYGPSMAESLLLNPTGGAVAVWTSSTLSELVPQADIGRAMLDELFTGATIGEATMRSKAATDVMEVRQTYILFGDPSMPLR